MTKHKHYTALGPSSYGYRTHGARIDVGVDVAGITTGVHGVGVGDPTVTFPTPAGVLGESDSGWGVRGVSRGAVAGVEGWSDFGPGVKGIGFPHGVEGTSSVGVYGEANFDDAQKAKDKGAEIFNVGVHGFSKAGTGTLGQSKSGVGVRGKSDKDRGGIFETGTGDAQLQLTPKFKTKPPKTGQAGDLLTLYTRSPSGGSPGVAELWFCQIDSTKTTDAVWRRVAFDPI